MRSIVSDQDDINYVYVKGQGWVPRLGPEPEPEPVQGLLVGGVVYGHTEWNRDVDRYITAIQRYQEERRAEREAREAQVNQRHWDVQTYRITPTTPQQQYYTYDTGTGWANLEMDTWYTGTRYMGRQQTRTVREAVRARYFPGSNTPGEPVTVEESPRDRQIREYRERLTRRGRRP